MSQPIKQLGGKLAGLSLPRQVMVLSIWPLAEQVLNLLVGTVDLSLAGHLEPEATAIAATDALGVTSFVGWLMGIVHSSVGGGAGALVSRAIGGKHRRLANSALAQALIMATCIGFMTALMVGLGAPIVADMVGLEGAGRTFCITYLQVISFTGPANALLMVGNSCLRASGDTRSPFFVMCLVNILNIGFSVLFVHGPEPIGGHGVLGIAAGTVIAWFCGGGFVIATLLLQKNGPIRLRLIRLRPHWHTIKRIVRVGLPNLAENVGGTWLATFLVLAIVGRLEGEGIVGAHMIAIRIESFAFQPGFAISIAAATLGGQYLGLGEPQRARQAGLLCALYASVLMMLLGVLFLTIPRQLAGLITDSQIMIDQSVVPLQLAGIVQIPLAVNMVLANALRGVGDTRTTMKLTYVSMFLVRVPFAWLLGHTLGYGLNGVWVALSVDITLRGLLFLARYLHGGWMKVEV